jgi:hypothetical protein
MFAKDNEAGLPSRLWSATGWPLLFAKNSRPDKFRGIVAWWEKRRLHYNLILLVFGVWSTYTYWSLFDQYAKDPSDDGIFPGLMPILFGIMANVFYTSGWVIESALLFVRRKAGPRVGRALFVAGLCFSTLLTLVPGVAGLLNTARMRRAHQSHWLY